MSEAQILLSQKDDSGNARGTLRKERTSKNGSVMKRETKRKGCSVWPRYRSNGYKIKDAEVERV